MPGYWCMTKSSQLTTFKRESGHIKTLAELRWGHAGPWPPLASTFFWRSPYDVWPKSYNTRTTCCVHVSTTRRGRGTSGRWCWSKSASQVNTSNTAALSGDWRAGGRRLAGPGVLDGSTTASWRAGAFSSDSSLCLCVQAIGTFDFSLILLFSFFFASRLKWIEYILIYILYKWLIECNFVLSWDLLLFF